MAQTTLREYLQETEDAITAGRLDNALAHCQQILAQFPESLEAQRLFGEVYLAQGRLEEALQCFDRVLTNDPENVVAYCSRALVCQKMSDIDTALDCYQQAYELSDGDGAIRKLFNHLSAQIGQPGFMYSRAGLARLYMRGDLLSHAILEWDAVLSVTPDRLDARLGLLETYWRGGSDEDVAQLAAQIVQDMPECLKALLLQAYVAAPGNSQKAQNILQRVQTLDPEMTMAQELFADTIAHQPSHPFFMLWKKSPAMINLPDSPAQSSSDATLIPVSTEQTASADTLLQWSELGNWGNLDIPIQSRQELSTAPESSAFSAWNNASTATNTDTLDPWSVLEQKQAPAVPSSSNSSFSQPPSSGQASKPELTWEQQSPFSDAQFWGNAVSEPKEQEQPREQDAYSWSAALNDNSSSLPPSWLSMLTQSEAAQNEPVAMEPAPVVDAAPEKPEEHAQAVPPAVSSVLPDASIIKPATQERVATHSMNTSDDSLPSWSNQQADDEENFSFGPEWLKALGATTMDSTEAETPQDVAESTALNNEQAQQLSLLLQASNEEHDIVVTDDTTQAVEPEPHSVWSQRSGPSFDDWTTQASEADESAILTTLESLEQDLYSKGFVPLEPNSLTTIAQSQEATSNEMGTLNVPEVQDVELVDAEEAQEDILDDASLSSALAQFGPLSTSDSASTMPTIPATPTVPLELSPVSSPWSAESSWASAWRATPQAPAASMPTMPLAEHTRGEQRPWQEQEQSQKWEQNLPETKTSVAPASKPSVPVPSAVFPATAEATKMTAARAEAVLDSELEMTMKRPAVRLQAMSPRVPDNSHPARSTSFADKGRSNELSAREAQNNYTSSYREHLVRGYQHQLVGDYDEAMQEYRLIIRSAPELLGEVISNVRALLKLAPKYSAGYRVLGDAYMRQGEYLQAMEAYNKALTMAKKARN